MNIPESATPAAQLGDVRARFAARFGRACSVAARAPGRVNLIGEHTDYNDGFVLPMATTQSTWVAAAARADGRLRAVSLPLDAEFAVDLGPVGPLELRGWAAYVAGVAVALRERGIAIPGADLLIDSDVPVGGGLSSSAALELAALLALVELAGSRMESVAAADLARQVEHRFARVPCGIMDQYASMLGRADTALLLDCRTQRWEHIPLLLGDYVVVVVDSGVRHDLAAGEYARRQAECRRAVELLRARHPQVRALRDATEAMVTELAREAEAPVAARARHVVTENARTLAAADALRRGDLARLGQLMLESHRSLQRDYEVSVPALDRLVEIAGRVEGVLGARLTGGGFGGCIVALVHRDALARLREALRRDYDAAGWGPARVLVTRAGPGAELVWSAAGVA